MLQVPVTNEQVIELASKGLVCREIAATLNCSESTINHRFAKALKNGRLLRDASLRRRQYDRAMDGSDTMLIWLGKQYLEQSDKQELAAAIGGEVVFRLVVDAPPKRNNPQLPENTAETPLLR